MSPRTSPSGTWPTSPAPAPASSSRTVHLDSSYYDTAGHGLLRSGLSLRRRTGDADTGWHLKVPGAGFRTELHWPLAGNDQPPDELRRLIWPFAGTAELLPTVTLRTIRTSHQVSAPDGRLVFEVADDEVQASSEGAPVELSHWRELEVELGSAGTTADLDRATSLLLRRGAFASRAGSKLRRALGCPDAAGGGSAAAVLTRYLREQCDALTAGHFAISAMPFEASSTSQPHEAVHQTRVATRRLRAALRIFGPLFEAEAAARLADELAWFAAELGEVRDREVLRNRLARAVDDLPAYLVVGPVASQIDEVLLAELRQHADALLATMRDQRYRELVAELVRWREQPPFTAAAAGPPSLLGDYVAAAERTLAKRMRRAAGAPHPGRAAAPGPQGRQASPVRRRGGRPGAGQEGRRARQAGVPAADPARRAPGRGGGHRGAAPDRRPARRRGPERLHLRHPGGRPAPDRGGLGAGGPGQHRSLTTGLARRQASNQPAGSTRP